VPYSAIVLTHSGATHSPGNPSACTESKEVTVWMPSLTLPGPFRAATAPQSVRCLKQLGAQVTLLAAGALA
jgi:hypothetical protein